MELTLEGMSSESDPDAEIDLQPVSKRAQMLKDALSQEREPSINPDINTLWEQFKAYNEASDASSTINSARMESMADLLKNPSAHLVSQYLKEREEYRIERQERVEREKEKRLKEQAMAHHKSTSSEDDFNERCREILAAKEEERSRRRSSKKKKGKNGTSKFSDGIRGDKRDKCLENLYSIPENRSFENSQSKSPADPKSTRNNGSSSHPNMIDPNMMKLREKISKQRKKAAQAKGGSTESVGSNSTALSDESTTAKDSSGEMQMWKMQKENWIRELEGQDTLQRNNHNNNKENSQPRHDVTQISKKKSQHPQSELKLLRLVKDGHLTVDEAYTVALSRIGKLNKSHIPEDNSVHSVENDSSFNSSRPHKFYSPYARSPTAVPPLKHAPKVKNFDRYTADPSYYHSEDWRETIGSKSDSDDAKYSKHQASTFTSSRINVYDNERRRPRSQSPYNAMRQHLAGQRKNRFQPPVRSHSSSPSRAKKDDFLFRESKADGGHQSRRKKNTMEMPKKGKPDFFPSRFCMTTYTIYSINASCL